MVETLQGALVVGQVGAVARLRLNRPGVHKAFYDSLIANLPA